MACDSPLWLKVKGQDTPVPCGKCPPCKIRRVNEWVFRITWEEENNSTSSHFVTLTYDTAHVPLTPNGFMTLRKRDFQNFMKRLRKLCPGSNLKYYACGEYGETYQRPHYHAIILNVPDPDLIPQAWTIDGVPLGAVHIGNVSGDSVAYTLKYIDKESFRQKRFRHSRDDRDREFPLMSKGLGKGYIEDAQIQAYHRADLSRNYVSRSGNHRVAMPRYYRQKLYNASELEAQREHINNSIQAKEQYDRLHHNPQLPYTYSEKLEFQREFRKQKFQKANKKRSTF